MSRKLIPAVGAMFMLLLACGVESQTPASKPDPSPKPQAYEVQDFSKLKGMPGFSDQALDLHFALYHLNVTQNKDTRKEII